ncbi:hypothetical protein [Methylobacterium sp. SD21]|uniref:hypothetical protein n=1 Tax=Methylobacterium litchii TaxID=3138810 RepID=UPI00313F2BBD
MPNHDELVRRKAIRAEAARRRRAAEGATPRDASQAAVLRRSGVNANTFYSRAYRRKLRGDEALPTVEMIAPAVEPQRPPEPTPITIEAARLIRRVQHLPGGRDPALHEALARLSANVSAARDAWAAVDAELAALLAADDPPTYH